MRNAPVVIIEDNDEDFEVLQLLLVAIGIEHPVRRYASPKEVIDLLQRLNRADRRLPPEPLPALILLDLNLPGMHGRDLLCRIREDARASSVPVIILTTSSNPRDVLSCYQAGANSYVVKPVDLDRLERTLKSLVAFWLHDSLLPATVERAL